MNTYELTVIIDGKSSGAKKKAVVEKITKFVTTLKGKVGKLSDWGVKDLAYQIKKSTSGVYLHFPLELEASGAKALQAKLRVEEELLRSLLIRK